MLTPNPNKKILIAPLDWGLGHATRCIPIIRKYLQEGAEVLVAADGLPARLLREEFPSITLLRLKGYRIRYAKGENMVWQIVKSLPKIVWRVAREHFWLKKVIKDYNINLVISDNRYGLFNRHIHCIFITHQLHIQTPVFYSIINAINHFFISKYNECLVPDFEDDRLSLAGKLSRIPCQLINSRYIGPLSRFEAGNMSSNHSKNIDVLFLLSGPEPQRGILEQLILSQAPRLKNKKCLVVTGTLQSIDNAFMLGDMQAYSHLSTKLLREAILSAALVVSRPGYSTIMDLYTLNKKALFIPTPGQTEQEYLARYLKDKGICYCTPQQALELETDIAKAENYPGFTATAKLADYGSI